MNSIRPIAKIRYEIRSADGHTVKAIASLEALPPGTARDTGDHLRAAAYHLKAALDCSGKEKELPSWA